ncbi:S-adenosyl-L-methionine-dependent methyltransferase [Lentinula aff. detonsa]|nr:S-adenosyl-L-methionine-dependent methyltransferase [Lentinula aff. detonsa]
MAENLLALSKLIAAAAATLDHKFKEQQSQFPDLNLDTELTTIQTTLLKDEQVEEATAIAVAAAAQLIATVRLPEHNVTDISQKFFISAALGAASAFNLPEIIRETGAEKGCRTEEIANKSGLEPQICARILRALATHHVFREVTPNVFANNRISHLLDTGKASDILFSNPEEKYINGAHGVSALMEIHTDEAFKATAYLTEALKLSVKDKVYRTPLSLSFNTSLDLFQWYELPENKLRQQRFSIAMNNTMKNAGTETVLAGFEWSQLPKDSTVVDVGARLGHISLELLQNFPHLKAVVQDRHSVLDDARKASDYWIKHYPEAVENKRVMFQGNDFFKGQPVKDAAVFLIRYILHDWSDRDARTILQQLRTAATKATKLVVIDTLVPFACQSSPDMFGDTMSSDKQGPYPLLSNYGLAGNFPHLMDIQMMTVLDGQERTATHMESLLGSAGWGVERIISPSRAGLVKTIVARPLLPN